MEAGGLLPRQPPQGPPGTISVCAGQGLNGHAGNVLGQSAATIHELNAAAGQLHNQQLHLQQQHQQQHQQHQQQQQQQMGQAPGMGEMISPKKQAVVDRLRRRLEGYRQRQIECTPRFDQSFNGQCEQNIQDTLVLKQRYLESKAKRQAKKTDKKQSDPVGLSSVHMYNRKNRCYFADDEHGRETKGKDDVARATRKRGQSDFCSTYDRVRSRPRNAPPPNRCRSTLDKLTEHNDNKRGRRRRRWWWWYLMTLFLSMRTICIARPHRRLTGLCTGQRFSIALRER